MNRFKVVALLIVAFILGVGVSETVRDARAQRADLPQRVAPNADEVMPTPKGPIATWVFSIGRDTVGRTQVDIIGLCRSAIENGLLK